jgi:hypothetical protein
MPAKETGSEEAMNYAAESSSAETPMPELANRKLIRNANVELEIVSFDDAVQKITAFAKEEHGYVATTDSQKQANGKLRGQVVVKVLPENLDLFLQKLRGLGELKNQTVGTEDVTKAYFYIDSRLKNARVMEQRLIEMLKTKTGKVSDLLQVEKELGRVREEIEKMQGELKYWDSQIQFATVTISLAEKDMEEPAGFGQGAVEQDVASQPRVPPENLVCRTSSTVCLSKNDRCSGDSTQRYQTGITFSVANAAFKKGSCTLSATRIAEPSRPRIKAASAFCELNTKGEGANAAKYVRCRG